MVLGIKLKPKGRKYCYYLYPILAQGFKESYTELGNLNKIK